MGMAIVLFSVFMLVGLSVILQWISPFLNEFLDFHSIILSGIEMKPIFLSLHLQP